jgi:hypothetical protein
MTNEWKIVERKGRRRNASQSSLMTALKYRTLKLRYFSYANIVFDRPLAHMYVHSFQAHIPHESPQLSKEKKDDLLDRIKKLRHQMQKICLVTDTIGEIQKFCGKHIPRLKLVCYGLGSFSSSINSFYQLAYALALEESIRNFFDTKLDQVEIFDPVMNQVGLFYRSHKQ